MLADNWNAPEVERPAKSFLWRWLPATVPLASVILGCWHLGISLPLVTVAITSYVLRSRDGYGHTGQSLKPLLCYLEAWESELPDDVRGPIPAWDVPQMLWTAELRLNDGFDEHDALTAFDRLINQYRRIEAGRPSPGFIPVSRPFPFLMRSHVRDWSYGGRQMASRIECQLLHMAAAERRDMPNR